MAAEERIAGRLVNRVPESRCPYCGQRFDAATSMLDPDAVLNPGDPTVCISCASALIFNRDLTVRGELYPGEIELTPALRLVQRTVRRLDRRDL